MSVKRVTGRVLLYHAESECAFWVPSWDEAQRILRGDPLVAFIDIIDKRYVELKHQATRNRNS